MATATLQGRAQIEPDKIIESESPGDLVFYLDGAHSPESMDVCAKWFSLAIKDDYQQHNSIKNQAHNTGASCEPPQMDHYQKSKKSSTQVCCCRLLFIHKSRKGLTLWMKYIIAFTYNFQDIK